MFHTQRDFLAFGFKVGDEPVQKFWAVKSALLFCEHFQVAQRCKIIGGANNPSINCVHKRKPTLKCKPD